VCGIGIGLEAVRAVTPRSFVLAVLVRLSSTAIVAPTPHDLKNTPPVRNALKGPVPGETGLRHRSRHATLVVNVRVALIYEVSL
jgi:hypothetical protein